MSKTVAAITLGCKVNAYDTESVLERFRAAGYMVVDFSEEADVYLVNTCTVTAAADRKSRQKLRQAAARGGLVVVTGCYAQNNPEEAMEIPGVHIVAGIKERPEIVGFVENYFQNGGITSRVTGYNKDRITFDNMPAKGLEGRTRAFVKIQEGCENFCSYCVIPMVRGPVRSRRLGDILREIKDVAGLGGREIVLTGISVASYGLDLEGEKLADVLRAANVPGIERVRLSSIGPAAITPEFIEVFRENKVICSHIHLSLQSGCDRTLEAMNRKYTCAQYAAAVQAIRLARPCTAVTTDIIAGFPGETEADFEESLEFVRSIAFADLHVFPFSPRKGTSAASMPGQIPKKVKEERVRRMMDLGKKLKSGFIGENLGKTAPVLFEKDDGPGQYAGFTPNYIEVIAESSEDIRGKVLEVRLEGSQDGRVIGVLI